MAIGGAVQLAGGILTVVYFKTMPWSLREYMAENLRSNYTGGLGAGFLERQYDRSVDWVQINVITNKAKLFKLTLFCLNYIILLLSTNAAVSFPMKTTATAISIIPTTSTQ